MRTGAFLAGLVISLPAFACSCSELSLQDILARPVLFIGEVVDGGVPSIRDDPWHSSATFVVFRVRERFRGVRADTETVRIAVDPTFGMCSPNPYFPGISYLVMPGEWNGKLFDGGCFLGRSLKSDPELISDVRQFFAGKLAMSIRGRVGVARSAESVRYVEKPLAGVEIAAIREGKTYRTSTDRQGRYFLTVPNGSYRLKAALRPYSFEEDIEVVTEGVVAERDIAARIDTSICGQVWDERGQPVNGARIGLIDRERESGEPGEVLSLRNEYSGVDGGYCFSQVPLGRYLVVFHPEGPEDKDRRDRTYYPRGSSRAKAERVLIDRAGAHLKSIDLVVGAPVAMREVIVTLAFPDGAPMKTAVVRVTGNGPLQPDLQWTRSAVSSKAGQVSLHAPADRSLRIEVRDWYGRDLGAKYESVHEAGATPISQKFVIQP